MMIGGGKEEKKDAKRRYGREGKGRGWVDLTVSSKIMNTQ